MLQCRNGQCLAFPFTSGHCRRDTVAHFRWGCRKTEDNDDNVLSVVARMKRCMGNYMLTLLMNNGRRLSSIKDPCLCVCKLMSAFNESRDEELAVISM